MGKLEKFLWAPTNELDLKTMLMDARESHYLEFKRTLNESDKGKLDLAKNVASFAINGGQIIIGVVEEDGKFLANPIHIDGVSERLDNIIKARISPQVKYRTGIISSENEGVGYVVINIFPSSLAPHMVDGKYYGRGEASRITLDDSTVRNMHVSKDIRESDGIGLIAKQVSLNKYSGTKQKSSHFYLSAQPIGINKLDVLPSIKKYSLEPNLKLRLDEIYKSIEQKFPRQRPFHHTMHSLLLEIDGLRISDCKLDFEMNEYPENRENYSADWYQHLRLVESGEVHYLNCGMSFPVTGNFPSGGKSLLMLNEIILISHQLTNFLKEYSHEIDFFGNWLVSIRVDNLNDKVVENGKQFPFTQQSAIPDSDEPYIRSIIATSEEMSSHPKSILQSLFGSLVRSTGLESRFVEMGLLDENPL